MRETILKKLNEIEKKESVRILLAVESGSRAWALLPRTATTMCVLSMSDRRRSICIWKKSGT